MTACFVFFIITSIKPYWLNFVSLVFEVVLNFVIFFTKFLYHLSKPTAFCNSTLLFFLLKVRAKLRQTTVHRYNSRPRLLLFFSIQLLSSLCTSSHMGCNIFVDIKDRPVNMTHTRARICTNLHRPRPFDLTQRADAINKDHSLQYNLGR